MKKRAIAMVLAVAVAAVGCAKSSSPPSEAPQSQLSVWAAYWDDADVPRQLEELGSRVTSVQYFAAYFDAAQQPFVPEQTTALKAQLDESLAQINAKSYLTFVNDWQKEGGSSLKDTDLLYALLETPEKRTAHAAQVVAMAKQGGFDGIEIDYEALRKDMTLWQHLIDFVAELNALCQAENLALRVVLEPFIPFEALTFPEGPQYVVMCYNLHWASSAPGPKADAEFLRQLVQKTANLPQKRTFALATDGFDWTLEGGKSLSMEQALALAEQHKVTPKRDEASGALWFFYRAENVSHEVWFADAQTLDFWAEVLQQQGDFDIAIWRL